MRNKLVLSFVFLSFLMGMFRVNAGPAPYTSVKIYVVQWVGSQQDLSADDVRRNAFAVISLKDVAAVDFWYSLGWENTQRDPDIAKRSKPLVMVMDFYGRTQDAFSGKPETLYCSSDTLYSTDGTYIRSNSVLKKIMSLLNEPMTP